MAQKIPSYLRLHVENFASDCRRGVEEIPGLASLCTAFLRATGWTLKVPPAGSGGPAEGLAGTGVGPAAESLTAAVLEPGGELLVDYEAAQGLADSLAQMLLHLRKTQRALWQREAELAAGVPVTLHPDEELHLAARLEAVLKAAAGAVDCQAAAAYLLDESTRQLKLRACWGLPKTRFLEPPRPLRGAAADLEALVGHVVAVEDTLLVPNWRVPEEFRSAVCVPISSPTNPLGTLWLFCDRPRSFEPTETDVLEIVAGRLAADLEREMLLQQTLQSRSLRRQLSYAAQWQESRCPRIKPLLHGWQVAGWTDQAEQLGGDFHDWSVLPDGNLAITLGDAQGKLIEAALTAAALHSAIKSHANYRHAARELVERANETLWSASAGDQFASLFYGLIRPHSGEMEFAAAGPVYAAVMSDQVRPLPTDTSPPLGSQPDADYPPRTDQLVSGDALVVVSEGVKQLLKPGSRHLLWRHVHRHRHLSAQDMLGKIQDYLDRQGRDDRREDRSVVIVKRQGAG